MSSNKQRGRGDFRGERAFQAGEAEKGVCKAKERVKGEEPGEAAPGGGEVARSSDFILRALGASEGLIRGKICTDLLLHLLLHSHPSSRLRPARSWNNSLQGGLWSRTGMLVTGMQAVAVKMERRGWPEGSQGGSQTLKALKTPAHYSAGARSRMLWRWRMKIKKRDLRD